MIDLLKNLHEKKKALDNPPRYIKDVEELIELYESGLYENKKEVTW